MITNSKDINLTSSEIERYIGVAALHVISVNPDLKKLNELGFNTTKEPEYVKSYTTKDGSERKYMRLRLLCIIDDMPDKPLVSLYFTLSTTSIITHGSGEQKIKVIDKYGNTAWVTKEQMKNKELPDYALGKMEKIYKPAHRGEEELIRFLRKYLNIAPYEKYDRASGTYVRNNNPGICSIDKWNELIAGDVTEVAQAIKTQPNNLVRVILGVNTTEDNKVYQTFINDTFLSYGMSPNNGVYPAAEKAIGRWKQNSRNSNDTFSAEPVKPYVIKPTDVQDTTKDIEDAFNNSEDADDFPF